MTEVATTGVLEGRTITLDSPVPPLEGRRVRVVISPDDADTELGIELQARLWAEWVDRGPQGPIDDEEEAEFP